MASTLDHVGPISSQNSKSRPPIGGIKKQKIIMIIILVLVRFFLDLKLFLLRKLLELTNDYVTNHRVASICNY